MKVAHSLAIADGMLVRKTLRRQCYKAQVTFINAEYVNWTTAAAWQGVCALRKVAILWAVRL